MKYSRSPKGSKLITPQNFHQTHHPLRFIEPRNVIQQLILAAGTCRDDDVRVAGFTLSIFFSAILREARSREAELSCHAQQRRRRASHIIHVAAISISAGCSFTPRWRSDGMGRARSASFL